MNPRKELITMEPLGRASRSWRLAYATGLRVRALGSFCFWGCRVWGRFRIWVLGVAA